MDGNGATKIEDYLEQHKVKLYLEDAICQMLELKEDVTKTNPAKFLSDYFYSVHNGTHTLFREYSYLQATENNRKSFIRTIWSCFRNVATYGAELLSVKEYHSLISLVSPDLPLDVIQKTARIVLMEDALDCLMSFVDFLYALQLQVFYEEFIELTKEAYDYLLVGNTPVKVPSTEDWKDSNLSHSRQHEGVESSVFFEAVKKVYQKMNKFILKPDLELVRAELEKAETVTFYSFLMSLSKNVKLNHEINVLPEREKVFEGKDLHIFLGTDAIKQNNK